MSADEPRRAVIYARYSSHAQREESIEDQVRVCQEAADEAGDEVVAVYFDRAVSGTTDRRDGFVGMVEASKGAEWKRVWTYKTDRFARNRYDAAIYKRKLQKNGVSLKYAAEPIPDGPLGIIMESVLEGMAEYYSANLGENVKRGHMGNALKGHPNGARRFGYDMAGAHIDGSGKYHPNDHYEVNGREAEAVRIMFSMRARGRTYEAIAERLLEEGYRNKSGDPITWRMVSRLIKKEIYKGVYTFSGLKIPGGIPAIVTERQWKAAQNPKVAEAAMPKAKRRYLHDLEGMTFGSYRVVSHVRTDHRHRWIWLCECLECGSYREFFAYRLTSGKVTHCTCRSPYRHGGLKCDSERINRP